MASGIDKSRAQTADLLAEALELHRRSAAAEAAARYAEVLRAEPGNADAHYYLAMIACQQGRFAEGVELARKALASNPRHAQAHVLLGRGLSELGQSDEAAASFAHAIALAPDLARAHSHLADLLSDLGRNAEAIESYDRALLLASDTVEDWFNRGLALRAVGRKEEAIASFDRAIAGRPDFAQAYLERANVLSELHRLDDALEGVDRALALDAKLAQAWHSRGIILSGLQRRDEALAAHDRALALKSDLAEAWLGRGNILGELKRYDEAFAAYDTAITLKPDFAEAWLGRGNGHFALRRHGEALAAHDSALALKPDLAEAWLGRGSVFTDLKRYDEAFAAYERALALKPDLAEAWLGRGNLLAELKRSEEAFAAYDRALALKSDLAEAWLGRGNVFFELTRDEDAVAAYHKALSLDPDVKYAAGIQLLAKLRMCDWTDLEAEIAQLLAAIRAGKPASAPFVILAISSSSADQLQCAKSFIADQPSFPAIRGGEIFSHGRIRVAYLSPDFREHPVAHLTVGLFEQHDRSRFEVTGLSFGPDQESAMRQRLKGAFERFVDVKGQSDQEIAEIIRRLEIDIAVDLTGFTKENRLNILARRAAPIQVNYLGYSGTMGADYIDYIIGDRTVIPPAQASFYSEKIAWLPDAFMVNDATRRIAERTPTRSECGLPEDGFVFCCFNNTVKIVPATFHVWMRLLSAIEGGVLWLNEANPAAQANLQREAERCGVSGGRLIFAPRMPDIADHLARHRQADLFLDTLPYNAHTTASDALWAGLPVLTCLGSTFAGRVAASLVKTVGLDELITHSLEDYEALALKLAREPSYLACIKAKLAHNRSTFPLFDTKRTTQQIEAAYTTMWQRYQSGEAPKCID
jgi:protein O-GlcNAc transferase